MLNPLGIFSYLPRLSFDFYLSYTYFSFSNSLYLWLLWHHTVKIRLIPLLFLFCLLRTHHFSLLQNFIASLFVIPLLSHWSSQPSYSPWDLINTVISWAFPSTWMCSSIIIWNFQNQTHHIFPPKLIASYIFPFVVIIASYYLLSS